MHMTNRHLRHSKGFTYIGLMLIVAIAGIALSGVGIVWKTEMQRENEKELRFAGEQYVAAIASYYECKVCGPNQLPKNLKDLLKDSRAPSVVHHIRKLYRDPMTRGNDWGLIKNGDRIMGVYSKSKLEPLAKPYDADLFKKKNATQSGNSVIRNQTNTDQANLNQVNPNQAGVNQSGGNNSNSNGIGTNLADLNKSDTSKTNQPIKAKKPSYQDWQFVYGGADQSVTSTQTAQPKTDQSQRVVLEEADVKEGERLLGLCAQTEADESKSCGGVCENGANVKECRECRLEVSNRYKACIANVR